MTYRRLEPVTDPAASLGFGLVEEWLGTPTARMEHWTARVACRMEPRRILGRLDCKRRLVRALRGCVQIACPVLDIQSLELVWAIPAYHGADDMRPGLRRRQSHVITSLRLVRGYP